MRVSAPGRDREPATRTAVRRLPAAVTIAILAAVPLTASNSTSPATTPAATAAPPAPHLDDDRAEQRELHEQQRADRHRRPEPPAVVAVPELTAASPVKTGNPRPTSRRQTPRPTEATKARAAAPRRATTLPPLPPLPAVGRAAVVVAFARAQVGKRYVWATDGPNTFDCSGLVVAAFRLLGMGLPHQTGGLAGRGRPVSRGELQPGDLVFPASGHVGIYVGAGLMVHASTPRGGVKLSPVYAFAFGRRLL
jgi:cell wall-associated NlpC family hydrolase